MSPFVRLIALSVFLFFLWTDQAHAYLDPGTGSVLVSTVLAVFGAIAYSLKSVYYKIFRKGEDAGVDVLDDTIVVFSEGKSYWGTFRPLVQELIKQKVHFRYISLDLHDPALCIDSPYMHARLYPKNNWSFEKLGKIKTPVMLSTTPNIGSNGYPLKKSPQIGRLVHVFHAMSATSNYRLGALDHYDDVIMVGAHQEDDLRFIEQKRNIPKKDMVALGIPYLDDLLRNIPTDITAKPEGSRPTVLIGPSWGDKGCFNEYGVSFVKELAKFDYNILIRLHPHSYLNEPEQVQEWEEQLSGLNNVTWDKEAFSHKAMAESDILISDTSSIRFDYAFLYLKPVITLDIPKKSRDAFEARYFETTWSETSSSRIGVTLDHMTIQQLPQTVNDTLQKTMADEILAFRNETIENYGESAAHIVPYLVEKRDHMLSRTKGEN